MKRFAVVLFSCGFLLSMGWLARVVWGQAAEQPKEKTYQVTQSQLDKYVADQVAKAVAAEREKKSGNAAAGPVTDEQVRNPDNWHFAVYNKAAYVIYTGPGQFQFHHWVPDRADAPRGGAGAAPAATPPAGKGP